MKRVKLLVLAAGLILLPCMAASAAGQGFGWRGDGSGRFPAADPPTQWNIDQGGGICWQTVVGKGQSSPVIAGQKVFITVEPALLVCLDCGGKVLWQRDNGLASLPPGIPPPEKRAAAHRDCGYATATPVSDGKFVYSSYGTGLVACHDLDGNRQWVRLFDQQQQSQYGRTTSPLLVGDVLLVTVNHLLALRRQTGETLWEAPDAQATYGTPAAARIGGVDVAITPHGECVRVSDGRVLAKKLCKLEYTSPLVHEGTVYFVGQDTFAARLPAAAGEQVRLERLWESDDVEGEFYASPVCHEGILYCASNAGILYALDAKTGSMLYHQELGIPSASGKAGGPPANLYASLTLAGKYLVACNDVGDSLVISPGRQYRQVARNVLDKGSGASPVAGGKLLLVRGGQKLYGLGAAAGH
ncbi:MAG: PQQ-binding-like beta-propeller repeat protein [Thermoguttaceae bacterium]|jgi:outer membrane protein assembly factor BamB